MGQKITIHVEKDEHRIVKRKGVMITRKRGGFRRRDNQIYFLASGSILMGEIKR